jgi:hypothetical protein
MELVRGIKYYIFRVAYIMVALFAVSCDEEDFEPGDLMLRNLTQEEQQLINASNQYAIDLLALQAQSRSQAVFSPLGIGMSLSLFQNAANGDQRRAIGNELGTQIPPYKLNKSFYKLLTMIDAVGDDRNMFLRNSIWHRNVMDLDPVFESVAMAYYQTEVYPIDFKREKSNSKVKEWVYLNSDGKMESASDFSITDDLRFVSIMSLESGIETSRMKYFSDEKVQYWEAPLTIGPVSIQVILPNEPLSEASEDMHLGLMEFYHKKALPAKSGFPVQQLQFSDNVEVSQFFKLKQDNNILLERLFAKPSDIDKIKIEQKLQIKLGASTPVNIDFNIPNNTSGLFFITDNHTRSILFCGIFNGN